MSKGYFLLYMCSVLIAAFSQVILKISANKTYSKKLFDLLNPLVIIAYGLFFLSMVLTTLALKIVPYKLGGVIESSSYLFILLFSAFILKEKVTKKRLWGNVIIVLGIVVFNL